MPRPAGSAAGARRAALLAAAVTVCYLALVGWQGVHLLTAGPLAARGLGLGVLLLPVVGLFVVLRELRFGYDTERLARLLPENAGPAADGAPPAGEPAAGEPVAGMPAAGEPEPARRPSGRVDRAAADAVFARRRAELEQDPGDWRRWYRLAVAYGDAGDTRRGRQAMRHAIALERRLARRPAGEGGRPPAS